LKKILANRSPSELELIEKDWLFLAREDQLPPDEWGADGCFIWNIRAGRGAGKTRAGAETFIHAIRYGGYKYPNLAGATAEDVRDIMIEGESGLLSCAPEDFRPEYVPSLKQIHWPNGVTSHIYYGSEPNKGRGPQSDYLWCDELAKWQYAETTFELLLPGLRLGPSPLCMITSTPQPTKFMRGLEVMQNQGKRPCTITTRAKTSDNFKNLSPVFSSIISRLQGTRQGQQELDGEFLLDNPGALWTWDMLDNSRVSDIPELSRIVVGVDPAVTNNADSDETGIVVAGISREGVPDKLTGIRVPHFYILGDYSLKGSANTWAKAAVGAYHRHNASRMIAEGNQGGDLVEMNIRNVDPNISFKRVHARVGKQARAEPISALYEQGRCHHYGTFSALEDQMTSWDPKSSDRSPDKIDALVWSVTELVGSGMQPEYVYETPFVGIGIVSSGHRV
jgi:phage terminase large subunit-like protein